MLESVAKLTHDPRSIFSIEDLSLILQEQNHKRLFDKIFYYVNQGLLFRITRGIYSKTLDYDPREFATTFYQPSYITFETVLTQANLLTSPPTPNTTFVASQRSKTITLNNHTYVYRKLKDTILTNQTGITTLNGTVKTASTERAFLDMFYLFPEFPFQPNSSLNWNICDSLIDLYQTTAFTKRYKQLRQYLQDDDFDLAISNLVSPQRHRRA